MLLCGNKFLRTIKPFPQRYPGYCISCFVSLLRGYIDCVWPIFIKRFICDNVPFLSPKRLLLSRLSESPLIGKRRVIAKPIDDVPKWVNLPRNPDSLEKRNTKPERRAPKQLRYGLFVEWNPVCVNVLRRTIRLYGEYPDSKKCNTLLV